MWQLVLTFMFCCRLAATASGNNSYSVQSIENSFVLNAVTNSQCVISATLNSESDEQIGKHFFDQDAVSNFVLNGNSTKTRILLAFSLVALTILIAITVLSTVNDYRVDENGNKKSLKFEAFSLRRNLKSLLSVDQKKSPSDVLCLHGMRAMCTFGIIYLHSYFYRVMAPVGQQNMYTEWGKTEVASRISSLNITVDTFFVISALLLTKSMLKDLDR